MHRMFPIRQITGSAKIFILQRGGQEQANSIDIAVFMKYVCFV